MSAELNPSINRCFELSWYIFILFISELVQRKNTRLSICVHSSTSFYKKQCHQTCVTWPASSKVFWWLRSRFSSLFNDSQLIRISAQSKILPFDTSFFIRTITLLLLHSFQNEFLFFHNFFNFIMDLSKSINDQRSPQPILVR